MKKVSFSQQKQKQKQNVWNIGTAFGHLLSRFTTLRWRLTLLNAALLTVLGIGLGVFIYFRLESYLYDNLRSHMQDYAVTQITTSTTNNNKNDGKSGGDGDGNGNGNGGNRGSNNGSANNGGNSTSQDNGIVSLTDLAKLLATRPAGEISPVVLDSSGQLVQVTGGPSMVPFQASLPTSQQLAEVVNSGRLFYITTSGMDPSEQLQVYLAAVKPTSGLNANQNETAAGPGYLMLVATLKPARDLLKEIEFLLISGVSALIILTILSGYPLTQLGLRPLKKITNTARQLRVSRLDQRVPLPNSILSKTSKVAGQDEIWQLVLEFNAMLEKIEKAFLAQQQNEARMRQFVADASHELRTPLTILGGYLDVLLMGALNDPSQTTRIVPALKQEIDRLSRLVIDLLLLTRLDAREGFDAKDSPLDLPVLLSRIITNMSVLAGSREIKLELLSKEEGIWINGNTDELYRVIINLLDNAIRYSNPGGKVQVILDTENWEGKDWARVVIRDNGCGIAPDQLPFLFNRFYRADKSRTRETGNSGLGLAISKGIVERHTGTICVESEVGKGTSFIIRLPLLGVELEAELV